MLDRLVTPSSSDWYRQTSWGVAEQKEFAARFKRSRQKAQCLVLQASTLVDTGNPTLAAAGLDLIDRMIADYPEPVFLSNAHLTRADALVRLGRADEAVIAFRQALEARRALPNVINYAYIEFAWTVARLGMVNYYDDVLEALGEFHQPVDVVFPVNAYRYFGALAFIQADRGDGNSARRSAQLALKAISKSQGPFDRHPDFGVVDGGKIDQDSHERLWALAAS